MKKIQNSYKKSGVNISIANKFVNHIAKISKKNVEKDLDYEHLIIDAKSLGDSWEIIKNYVYKF